MLRNILLLIFIHSSLQRSTPSDRTYDAAVIEFNYGLTIGLDPVQLTEVQLEEYTKILVTKIRPSSVDIIVFPEWTLNDLVTAVELPNVEDKISPCLDVRYGKGILKKISCLALMQNSYVVINIITKALCPDPEMIANGDPRNCGDREDGFSYYNTNVVFNRRGVIVSRYRKYNLFNEDVDRPYIPELITFETDFGVTFGHFVCFDLLFRYPAAEVVRSLNVTDIIYPTMWYSQAPFLTAAQIQQNWAHSLDVNFLAAGANFPAVGSTGTGIYGGNKGAYVMEMSATDKTSIYTAKVYKKIPRNENVKIEHKIIRNNKNVMKDLKVRRESELAGYDLTFLNDTAGTHYGVKEACLDSFCCSIKVNYTIRDSAAKERYQYVLAFNYGSRSFGGFAEGGHLACAIIACTNNSISSCGVRDETLKNVHLWKSIDISGKFPKQTEQYLYMPTSLDTSILPLQPEEFDYVVERKGDKDEISINLKNNDVDLLTFGIYGRDFSLDT